MTRCSHATLFACGLLLTLPARVPAQEPPEIPAGFEVLKWRWIVEPGALWAGFAWLGRNRRLSKAYEYLPESSEAFIHLAMIRLTLVRLAKK